MSLKFIGLGQEGLVTAAKELSKAYVAQKQRRIQQQSYYDAKKSGGLTESDVRIALTQNGGIKEHSKITDADIALVSSVKLIRRSQVLGKLRDRGTLVVCSLSPSRLSLTEDEVRTIRDKKLRLLKFDELSFRKENNVPSSMRSNVFYAQLMNEAAKLDVDMCSPAAAFLAQKHVPATEDEIRSMFGKLSKYVQQVSTQDVAVVQSQEPFNCTAEQALNTMIKDGRGNQIPTSAFTQYAADSTFKNETSVYEKPNSAINIPSFSAKRCIQCGKCTLTCPHGCIRAYLMTDDEIRKMNLSPEQYKKYQKNSAYRFVIGISAQDCTGCKLCSTTCPTAALPMIPNESEANKRTQRIFDEAERTAQAA